MVCLLISFSICNICICLDNKLKQDYILLKTQCTELDNANRAWQQFYQNQIDLLKNQLKDYLDFDQNLNFDQIIQIIAVELEQKKQLKGNIPLGKIELFNVIEGTYTHHLVRVRTPSKYIFDQHLKCTAKVSTAKFMLPAKE